jgi:bifunctional DNA-binding transcriptional regulator/antitoxin component of YhaV-PrlF toxin-antitoxin module
MSHRFVVTLEEDEYGDLIMPIPEEVLDELGWTVGDGLDYTLDEDSIILRKSDE